MTAETHESPRWSLATRIAFRFLFSYFVLYSLLPALVVRNDFLREKYFDVMEHHGRLG